MDQNVGYPILSVLIFLPLAGAVVALFLKGDGLLKAWATAVTTVEFLLSIPLWTGFRTGTPAFQFRELWEWIPALDIRYALGIDGISVLLVLLTTLILPLCVLCSWRYIEKRVKEFVFALLVMETAMIGVFCALDLVLFYVFWESMLIPMYLLIAVWGGPNRTYASIKFFLYTLAGSVLLLVAIIALYLSAGTFSIPDLMARGYSFAFQFWVFLAFALAFAIKVPMFPFHTWLPAAHVEAPTAGSVVLASVLLKMGTYGFLRFCLPMTPLAAIYLAPVFLWGSVISILYGGFIALGQTDMKKLIAYSSVGHMGFVTLGIFLVNQRGIEGALLQMINHGITTGALFICVGVIYERTHSRLIADNSAVGSVMPMYVGFLGLFSLSSLAFPGTNSFVGELLVLIGAFSRWKLLAAFAVPGALLAAAYMLRLLQKIVWAQASGHHGHGEEHGHGHGEHRHLRDLDAREFGILAFLTIFVFWIGLGPKPFLHAMDASIAQVIGTVEKQDRSAIPRDFPGLMSALGLTFGHEPTHGGPTPEGEHAAPGAHGVTPPVPAGQPGEHAPSAH
ncbi:MAG: NADH-quinone oxidoreductase subunit M [Deltaproteobacteria bacterium]|nr:NADH-quinone oxidoreductase subunit M [Deltaproteobacteria bacterium]